MATAIPTLWKKLLVFKVGQKVTWENGIFEYYVITEVKKHEYVINDPFNMSSSTVREEELEEATSRAISPY